jgi:hypothetical protein
MFQAFFEVEKKRKRVLFLNQEMQKRSTIMFAVIIYTTCTTLARSHTAAALNNKTKNFKHVNAS